MASAMPRNLTSEPRVPQASYLTKSSDTESVNSTSTDFSRDTVSTNPTSPLHSDFCPSPSFPPSEPSSPPQSRSPSCDGPPSMSPNPPGHLPKKRSNFFSGLFSVKEPSAQALVDYERQLLKHGNGRVIAVGLPGVSSAKLPPTVPKVNSKWDGVPQTVKDKETHLGMANRQSASGTGRNVSTSRSAGSETRSISTPASKRRLSRGTLGRVSMQSGSSNNLAELYGWETPRFSGGSSSEDFAIDHVRPSASRTASSWSAPPFRPTSSFPSPQLPRPSTTPTHIEQSPSTPPASPNLAYLSNSTLPTPVDSSPATPDAPLTTSPPVSILWPRADVCNQDNFKTAVLEAPSSNEVIIKSAGVNILGPPAATKRRPKPPPFPPGEGPTTAGAEPQLNSILKKQAKDKTPSPSPSLASFFTNTTSGGSAAPASHDSTRERLGLGMILKNHAVAPWQSPVEAGTSASKGERIITPTPESEQPLRRKNRISLFKK